jgi:glycosyltransferase involved in cell wall biosynthesis
MEIHNHRKPLVSVIMNCYNGAKFLVQAIESVRAQTYQNWEIIFWDNRSTDLSAEIFCSYQDSRLRYFLAQSHTPLYDARNKAIEKSSGDFIAFLDVDDIWVPEKLALQIPLFDNPKIGFSCGKYILLNQRRSKVSQVDLYAGKQFPMGMVTDDLLNDYFIHVSTLVVRKSILQKISGPCNPRFNIIGDLDLAIKLSRLSELAVVQKPIAQYRWHGSNTGINPPFSFCYEFEKWFIEQDKDPDISKLKGYQALKDKNLWSKCIKAIYEGRKVDACRVALLVPFPKMIKVFAACFLPTAMAKKIINR